MGTFYGYAEREAGDQVDWSVIGSDITKMLKEEVIRRDELKSEIDKATRAYGTTLSEAPTGQHQGASDAVIDYAENASSARLVQDKLLKSGQLKVKDYLRQRQNLLDGTNTMFAAAKAVQEETATKIERMVKDGSAYEMALFKASEGFTNWNNVGAYIDPTSYRVSLGKKIKKETADGKVYYEMGDSPGDFLTASELYNFATLKMDRVDLEKPMDEIAANMAMVTQQILKNGKLIITKDPTGRIHENLIADKNMSRDDIKGINNFNKVLNTAVDAMYGNPIKNGSIASDYYGTASNGKNFKFVWTKEEMEASPENIYLEKDPAGGPPTPMFHDGEVDDLKRRTKRSVIQRLSQSYEEKTEFKKDVETAANKALRYGKENAENQATNILADWVAGASAGSSKINSEASYNNVINLYNSLNQGKGTKQIKRIDKVKNNSIQIIYSDNSSLDPIPLGNKKAYIRAIKGLFPSQFNDAGFNDDEIEAKGLSRWTKDKSGNDFNPYNIDIGVNVDAIDPGDLVTEESYDANKNIITKTSKEEYDAVVDDGLLGRRDNNVVAQEFADVSSRQVIAFNRQRKKAGRKPLTIETKSSSTGNLYVKNPENNAKIDMKFYESAGMSDTYQAFMANVLNYQSGVIGSDEQLAGAYKNLLEVYSAAINQAGGTLDDKVITLAGTSYSYNDMVVDSEYTTNFDTLIEMAKNLKQGQGSGTGGSGTGATGKKPTPVSKQ